MAIRSWGVYSGRLGRTSSTGSGWSCVQAEEVELPLQVFPPVPGQAVQEGLVGGHQLGAEDPHGVKGPGADEAFHHPLVQVLPLQALAEVGEGA